MTPVEEIQAAINGKEFTIHAFCRDWDIKLRCQSYADNKRVAILAEWTSEEGFKEPFGMLTCNLPQIHLEPYEILVKTWGANEELAQEVLEKSGLFLDTGKEVATGFCFASVWEVII